MTPAPHTAYRACFRSLDGERVLTDLWRYVEALQPDQQVGAALLMGRIHRLSDPANEPPAPVTTRPEPPQRLPRSA